METKGLIWKDPNDNSIQGMEVGNSNNEPYCKMANHLSEIITKVLTDDYKAQIIIKNMIVNLIEMQLSVFLREYDNVVADDILRSFKSSLTSTWDSAGNSIKNDVKFSTEHADYAHARHAKLSSFARELREKIVMLKKSE